MKPEDVSKSYDSIAERWRSDLYSTEYGIAQHQRAIEFVNARGPALDIGCGASGRIIQLLLEQGFVPEGLDLSIEMLKLARERHSLIEFHQADICKWKFSKGYQFISAWDSIWHIPLAENQAVLTKIFDALVPGGVFIFTTGGVDDAGDVQNSAMGPPMYHSAPGLSNILRWVTQANCVCRHLEYDQYPELHVYLIVQKL